MSNYLSPITDIHLALWPSSWGRLQCNAETADGKKYQSWAGRPEQELTLQMIIDAFDLIKEQLTENEDKTG